jgi:hypothetical protein
MIERTERGTMRMNRQGRMLIALIAAAILIGLLAAWLSRGEFKGRYAVPSLGARTAQSVPTPAPAPTPVIRVPEPTPPARVVRQAPPAPTLVPPVEENADAASPPDGERDHMARAIEKAARKALDRGEPVRWHKAGERGYVVVSEPRDSPGRTCRNVSATINSDNGQTRSNSHLWCRPLDGGAWAPAE